MSEPEVRLRVEGLEVGYGEARSAIRDADLHVRAGEMVAVLGTNGAGKTTLLHSIAGLLPVRAGRILLRDRDVTGLKAHRRVAAGIGLALEGHQVINELTVEDNLRLGLFPRWPRMPQRAVRAQLESAFEVFNVLADRRSALAGSLSGGQQQMLAIARLLVADSEVLLLDEPSLGLAPAVSESLYGHLRLLRDAGSAVVVVEQNAALANQASDRSYLLTLGALHAGESGGTFTQEQLRQSYLAG